MQECGPKWRMHHRMLERGSRHRMQLDAERCSAVVDEADASTLFCAIRIAKGRSYRLVGREVGLTKNTVSQALPAWTSTICCTDRRPAILALDLDAPQA